MKFIWFLRVLKLVDGNVLFSSLIMLLLHFNSSFMLIKLSIIFLSHFHVYFNEGDLLTNLLGGVHFLTKFFTESMNFYLFNSDYLSKLIAGIIPDNYFTPNCMHN